MRILMMGTGDFAVPTLAALYDSSHEVLALYTQPERIGRGHHQVEFSAIKKLALSHDTSVRQPENINVPEVLDDLRAWQADVFVVAAYGQLLKPELLAIPKILPINVHASLLPKYRGAAPVAFAIWKGETETGVTIIKVEPKLDAGEMLAVESTPIGPHETAGELEDRLALIGGRLAVSVVDRLARGERFGVPQDPALATRATKLKKEMGEIRWSDPARDIDHHVRAMNPWPMADTYVHVPGRKPLRVLIPRLYLADTAEALRLANPARAMPGEVVSLQDRRLFVATGNGVVEIRELKPEGKRLQTVAEFLNGNPLAIGHRLGSAVS